MYGIAEIMARVFPAYRAFGRSFLKGMDLAVPTGPFPKDTLAYRGKKIVEYTTPAQTEGLGNFHSWLGKNDFPIRGAAIVVGDAPATREGPEVVLLSVRVPSSLTTVVPMIIDQFEHDTIRSGEAFH
jgi:hypothetical protein